MAKLFHPTARDSALSFFQSFPAGQTFKVSATGKGFTAMAVATPGDGEKLPDGLMTRAAAQAETAKLFTGKPADGVYGVTKDKLSLSVGELPAAKADQPAAASPAPSPSKASKHADV